MRCSSSVSHITVGELKRLLESLPPQEHEHQIDGNRALVQWLSEPEQALALLRQVLADAALLGEVAARSYRHVNLFDKIVLVGNNKPQGYRLTLHLWTPPYTQEENGAELIHEHRFNFWSAILLGTMSSENYEKANCGRPYRRYRYTPEAARSLAFCDFYEFCGNTTLNVIAPGKKTAGESYYLAAPRIHRIVLPQDTTTCSMVLRGPRQREYSYVYNSTYPANDTRITNKMFSENELAIRLAGIITNLESAAAAV
jgi:hypothetical protein